MSKNVCSYFDSFKAKFSPYGYKAYAISLHLQLLWFIPMCMCTVRKLELNYLVSNYKICGSSGVGSSGVLNELFFSI